jgi:hypothetical protein
MPGRAREALTLLARYPGTLRRLQVLSDTRANPWDPGPGHLLGAVTAAYSGTAIPPPLHPAITSVLRKMAGEHALTPPMAGLLTRLDPGALDSALGPDVAASIDADLGLAAGTSGRVLRALVDRLHIRDDHAGASVRRAADRSAQELPAEAALPDFQGWGGQSVAAARSISACLVRARLAAPDDMPPDQYLATIRALWTPSIRR